MRLDADCRLHAWLRAGCLWCLRSRLYEAKAPPRSASLQQPIPCHRAALDLQETRWVTGHDRAARLLTFRAEDMLPRKADLSVTPSARLVAPNACLGIAGWLQPRAPLASGRDGPSSRHHRRPGG